MALGGHGNDTGLLQNLKRAIQRVAMDAELPSHFQGELYRRELFVEAIGTSNDDEHPACDGS